MHLALITNCYPDGRANSEYGFHLADGLRRARPNHRVTVLAGSPGPPGVARPWSYSGLLVCQQVLRSVSELRPDGVLVNCSFNSWGHRVSNLAGFWAISRLARRWPTVALLHYLPQTLPVERTGYRLTRLDWLAIHWACKMLARARTVAFTLERDRLFFSRHYKPDGTIRVEHGLLGDLGSPGWDEDAEPTVLAFGYWGPGKNLESLLEAVTAHPRPLRLIVAGASHPRFPGYLEGLRRHFASPRIEWTGYVAEDSVAGLFRRARLVVLPYCGDTGTSGVLHLACQHGRAVLANDLPVLRGIAAELSLSVNFYRGAADLPRALSLVEDSERLTREGRHNLEAVRHLDLARVAETYWELLEVGAQPAAPALQGVARR
ncbi:MAG: hypothetical protein AB1758_21735 [Candidatus Eremiobacterota bacterium]